MTPLEKLDARAKDLIDYVAQRARSLFEVSGFRGVPAAPIVAQIAVVCRLIAEDRERADLLQKRIEELELEIAKLKATDR